MIYGYNESVRSDGVIVAWKADNSSILYSLYWVRPSWFVDTFLVKGECIREKGRLDSRIDIALDVATILFSSLCLYRLKSLKIKSYARKDVLTDLMKRDASQLVRSLRILESRADVGSKGNVYLRAYRKGLGAISKGEQLPAWSKWL